MTPEQHIRPILIELYWQPLGNEYEAAKEILKTFGRGRDKWAVESIASVIRRKLWNYGWKSCLPGILEVVNRANIKGSIAA